MKKIIWIFGQSATGKKTLINKLLENDQKTLEELKLCNVKITASKNTIEDNRIVNPSIEDPFTYNNDMQEDNEYFNRSNAINRRSCIMTDCLNFLNSDDDILLIKGQDNDFWPKRGDIVKYFLETFANLENIDIEIFMLTVFDDNLWKQRINQKEWFKNFEDKDGVMKNMLEDRLNHKHETAVINAFEGYNIPITYIDSGKNQYTILSDLKERVM